MWFFLVAFVLAFIRPLTAVTAAATPSILFTEMIVYILRMLSARVILHRIELINNNDDYCLFHLLVQKYFDRVQYFLNMNNFFSPWSKMIFYLINLHIWARSKIFDHIQTVLNEVKNFFELADGIGIHILNSFRIFYSFTQGHYIYDWFSIDKTNIWKVSKDEKRSSWVTCQVANHYTWPVIELE